VIQGLIARGADVNARDKGNWTALHLAARNGHVEGMRVLLDAGAELAVQDSKHG
jgi:ankyrin repeat protein